MSPRLRLPSPSRAGESVPVPTPPAPDRQASPARSATMSLVVAVAVIIGSLCLAPLTSDRGYWPVAAIVVLIVQVLSALSRRFRVHPALVHLWQLLALAAVGVGLGLSAAHSQHLGGSWWRGLGRVAVDGITVIQTQAAPMPADPSVRWLIVLVIGVVAILADVLVVTLESAGWAIAPLLAMYLVPALADTRQAPWWGFVAVGAAFLLVLLADQLLDSTRWTRNLGSDSAHRSRLSGAPGAVLGVGTAVGVPALALALLAGSALPTFGSLDITSPRPRGNGPIQMTDPTIDLQRNLNNQSTSTVLSYTTSSSDGEYLRLASLTKVDSAGWHLAPVNLSTTAPTSVPGLTGPSTERSVHVRVGNFSSEYLPAPYAPTSSSVGTRDWAWDPTTLAVVATGTNRTEATRGLSYDVSATSPDPDLATFETSGIGHLDDQSMYETPTGVPNAIITLTRDITQSKTSPVAKAVAIQEWLRDPRRFTYSTTAPPGSGYDVLTNFLTKTHSGYCIHFASAMALMARIEGIPSRVSVGFLPGTKSGQSWDVKASNMHAWPELYFQNYGWVRFEPTAGVAQAPAWTVENPDSGVAQTPTPSAEPSSSTEPSSSASTTPSTSASPEASQVPSVSPTAVGVDSGTSGIDWGRVLTVLGWVLLGVVVLAAPMAVRMLLRRRRLGAGDPAALATGAWREVRDEWIDHGLPWPTGTPRQQLAAVRESLGADAVEPLERLAVLDERARFARTVGDLGDVRGDVGAVREAVRAGRTRRPHWMAVWLPLSLVRRH